MSNINADLKAKRYWAIVASCVFVLGIPLIIYGAINSIWFLLGVGAACVLFGFYGTPILWVNYGSLRSLKRVVDAVMEEHITSVNELSQHLSTNNNSIRQSITKAINKKYITGYIFDGNNLISNTKQSPKKQVIQRKCANCGGTLIEIENGWKCEYCGSNFNKE